MSEKYSIEDKVVHLFLSGSHEFTGRVEYVDDIKVVLTSEMGSLVIYRKHIIAAMILDEKNSRSSIDHINARRYDNSVDASDNADSNNQENYYGSVIPSDMLIGKEEGPQVSFSLNMSDIKDPKLPGDKYGSKKENGSSRKDDPE